jgi:hypothetical protein
MGAVNKRRAARLTGAASFKARHDYDRDPPRCANCTFLLPRAEANGVTAAHGPWCNVGKFPTVAVAVCDRWQGRRGELLEDRA